MNGEPSEAPDEASHDAAHAVASPIPPLVNYPEASKPSEWAVGIVFVLATVAIVVAIGLSIAGFL